jgi:TonB family protein
VLSVGAHLVLLALLIVVHIPGPQLPEPPPPDAPSRGTVLLRVGMVSQHGAEGTPERPAPGPSSGVSSYVPRPHAGGGSAPETPDAPSALQDVEPRAGATARADTSNAAEVGSGAAEGFVGGDSAVGKVTGGEVVGGEVAGGDVTGGDVTGGDVTGGDVTGGEVAGGEVAGGHVAGGHVAGGHVAGGHVAGGHVAGGHVAGGHVAGGHVAGGRAAGAGAALAADVVGLVHARLAAGAERCYPAAARRYQQRGTAEVRFCVDASGRALETSLVKTSGSSLLDAAVGECVLPAASPFPSSVQGHCFAVPVRFGTR